ncbi:efflux RND transporter periplasmic adaptor subunit [Rhodocyclus tenuis]|uniref:Efflux RND transporter periplasmic adaptor subunit n=1 Tax=Rhodocyclus gracilis TaxID=2929842 RepID=A0ABX0WD52_9RHOO|nr:efflux RND transporter periplasmic adaptor subunit [Rhodocyclus gracilis]NJA87672.1 efflux RND transporter periplasmic adaptor subunit [Rhodocyclus gracilis]
MQDSSQHPASSAVGSWRSLVIAGLVLAAVAAGLWAWRTQHNSGHGYTPPGAIDVVAVQLVTESAPDTLSALGELRAVRQVSVANEIPGRIARIAFTPGQSIKAGTLLVQLDDAIEQANLLAAQASARFAQQQWERASELAESGAIARELLEQRRAERDQSAAQLLQLETRIRKMHVRAPFAGELGLRQVDIGQYLNAGDKLVTLTDLDSLYVNFDVPQQALGRLRVGQHVAVRSDTPGATPLPARISAIEPQVGRDTRNATVQATLANPQRALRPGMYVTVAVELPAEPDALLIPATAVLTSAIGDAAVVVRDLDAQEIGKAEIVPLTLGRRIGDRVLVERGLKAGDLVVSEGQLRIQPGAAVHRVQKPAADAAVHAGSGQ